MVVMSCISRCKEDVSEGKMKGLTVKQTVGSQGDRPAELKSDRQRNWEQKREMKRTTQREREGKKEGKRRRAKDRK